MPRPRDTTISERRDDCPVHGVTTFREHKVGFTKKGTPKTRWRCMECHAERNRR
jgi:transposase-like protein